MWATSQSLLNQTQIPEQLSGNTAHKPAGSWAAAHSRAMRSLSPHRQGPVALLEKGQRGAVDMTEVERGLSHPYKSSCARENVEGEPREVYAIERA